MQCGGQILVQHMCIAIRSTIYPTYATGVLGVGIHPYICMYVCLCMYVYVCVCMCMYVYVCARIIGSICMRVYARVCVCI